MGWLISHVFGRAQDDGALAAALRGAINAGEDEAPEVNVKEEMKEEEGEEDQEWWWHSDSWAEGGWSEMEVKEEDGTEEATSPESKVKEEDFAGKEWSPNWPFRQRQQPTNFAPRQHEGHWKEHHWGGRQQWWGQSTWTRGWKGGKGAKSSRAVEKAPWSKTNAEKPATGTYIKGGFRDEQGTVWPTLVLFLAQPFQMAFLFTCFS